MAFVTQTSVVPGPCTNGCPEPTEIVCIEVNKVYDSCFQTHSVSRTFLTVSLSFPGVTLINIGSPVNCALNPALPITCSETGTRTPVGNTGFWNVSVVITVPIILIDTFITPAITLGETLVLTKTVVLCAPPGTSIECSVSLLSCNSIITSVLIASIEIVSDFLLCVVIKAVAEVNLLVPSYGFCVPAECTTSAICPPPIPPQCVVPGANP